MGKLDRLETDFKTNSMITKGIISINIDQV